VRLLLLAIYHTTCELIWHGQPFAILYVSPQEKLSYTRKKEKKTILKNITNYTFTYFSSIIINNSEEYIYIHNSWESYILFLQQTFMCLPARLHIRV